MSGGFAGRPDEEFHHASDPGERHQRRLHARAKGADDRALDRRDGLHRGREHARRDVGENRRDRERRLGHRRASAHDRRRQSARRREDARRRDVIASRPRREELPFVGRTEEVTFLERLTTGRLPSITCVNGIGGIGKSRLLDALARRRRNAGGAVVHIDGRLVEPTEAGFYRELSRAAGGEIASCEEAAQRLAELGDVVLLVDDIDALRLLDAWLRRALVPSLPPNVHVVFSGRDPPLAAWLQTPWRGTFRSLELAPLADGDAVTLLTEAGIEPAQASRVNRIARGHPLALTLAATTLQSVDDPALEDLAFHRIVAELARRHLAEIPDPVTRRAVVAAAL